MARNLGTAGRILDQQLRSRHLLGVPDYRFHTTKHEALRVSERDLSVENMKNVIRYPDSEQPLRRGIHGGAVKKFWKTVDDKTLVVVAEIKGSECWLLTGFFAD